MLELLSEFQKLVNENKQKIISVEGLPEDIPDIEVTINNNDLLTKSLVKIFKEEKSKYLPSNIPQYIEQYINDIKTSLQEIQKEPDNIISYVQPILSSMEKLYAHCMKYGLITFGFNVKEEISIIQDMRNKIGEVTAKINGLKRALDNRNNEIESLWTNSTDELNVINKSVKDKIEQNSIQFEDDVNNTLIEIKEKINSFNSIIEEKTKEAEGLVSSIEEFKNTSEQNFGKSNEVTEQINETKESVEQIFNEVKAIKEKVDIHLNETALSTNKTDEQLKNATQCVAEINTKNNSAAEIIANMKQREDEINEFYQEIEEHKEEMLKNKKKADADYTSIKNNFENTLSDYDDRNNKIIENNESYQSEIKNLLHKAVSAGLFGVFKQRQKYLAISRYIWAVLVFASSIAVVWIIYSIASSLAEANGFSFDKAFFIRSGMMIPLIYLMYFSGSQYKKERQAEEEYAFKSAISFSLEPYRDLLVKMREDEELEADFVKKLMEDIFDNPVIRIYRYSGKRDGSDDFANMISSLFGKIPSDKRKMILNAVTKAVAGDEI